MLRLRIKLFKFISGLSVAYIYLRIVFCVCKFLVKFSSFHFPFRIRRMSLYTVSSSLSFFCLFQFMQKKIKNFNKKALNTSWKGRKVRYSITLPRVFQITFFLLQRICFLVHSFILVIHSLKFFYSWNYKSAVLLVILLNRFSSPSHCEWKLKMGTTEVVNNGETGRTD